ncbi:MAG: hypothetical protein DMF63_02255 [Acidobacteria bacterium]|nr:MAG: hypothetical protein DMF63_02255 [Acidobacteriota bacterium]
MNFTIIEKVRLSFAASLFACLCGCPASDPGLLRTTNAESNLLTVEQSKTVVAQTFPLPYDPQYTKVFDVSRWMVADHSEIWTTKDGGKSWNRILKPVDLDSNPVNIRGISFGPEGRLIVASDRTLLKSLDFGQTWEKDLPLKFTTTSIFFLNDEIGWATAISPETDKEHFSMSGSIYETVDGGKTWTRCRMVGLQELSSELGNWSLGDIFVRDDGIGLAVGDGVILSTSDNGETWRKTDAPKYKYFRVESSKELAWATSAGNNVITTTSNNGRTWKDVTVPADNRDTVQFAYFVDDKNALLGMNHLFRTTSGGKDWRVIGDEEHTIHIEELKTGQLIRLVIENEKSFAETSFDKGRSWNRVP